MFDFLMCIKNPEVYKALYWNFPVHESREFAAYQF